MEQLKIEEVAKLKHKAKKEDKIKIIHSTEFDDFNDGDILMVNDTWYGGVWAKDEAGVSVAVNEDAYEILEAATCNKSEEKKNHDAVVLDKFTIMHGNEWMQPDKIKNLLGQTYWANARDMETIKKSIDNSLCYGAFRIDNGEQIAFARVLTDYATTYYLCDVVVDEQYRGAGIGKAMLTAIQENEEISSLRGILATQDAHDFYKQFGFMDEGKTFMGKLRIAPGKKEED